MSEKPREIKDLEAALVESVQANKDSSLMSGQLKKLLEQQEAQGRKIDTIHDYFKEDPIRGTKGVIIDITNLRADVRDLQIFRLVVKKQALLVSAASSFFISIIVGVAVFYITKNM